MANSIIDGLRINPDNIDIIRKLKSNNSLGKWIFDLTHPTILHQLGLNQSIYSEIQGFETTYSLDQPRKGTLNFYDSSNAFIDFLRFSTLKNDVLKPFKYSNLFTKPFNGYFYVKNATIICSSLSIAILDENKKVIYDCSHNAPESLFIWFQHHKPEIPTIDKAIFASIQQPFNIGHWCIDLLPQVYLAYFLFRSQAHRYTLLVDSCNHNISVESLKMFPFKNVVSTYPYCALHVNELIIPKISSSSTRALIAKRLAKTCFSSTNTSDRSSQNELASQDPPLKIYISRQRTKRRRILNNDKVEEILQDANFTILYPEELSQKQASILFSKAKYILGPNGAAFTNILYNCNSRARIGIIYPVSHVDDYYFRLSYDLGLEFYGMTSSENTEGSDITQMVYKYYYPDTAADFHVSIEKFKYFLSNFLA